MRDKVKCNKKQIREAEYMGALGGFVCLVFDIYLGG